MSLPPIRSAAARLALGLGACVLMLGIATRVAADPPPAPGSATPALAATTGLARVHAAFVSGAGEAGIRSVQMFLDGREVTSGSDVSALRVAYTPAEKLSPGRHEARVVVIDSLGKRFEKEWSFEVAEPERPQVLAFFTGDLAIDLDPLPRRLLNESVGVRGTTLPGAEIAIRVDGDLAARVVAGANGRFEARIELARGENEITFSAARLDTGDEGAEITRRIERVELASVVPTRPPTTWTGEPMVDRPVPVARHVEHEGIAVDPEFEVPDDGTEPPPITEVVITKPSDGQALHSRHVTVLGRAPAGWSVALLVDGEERGDDVANPAGHFTIPRVDLGTAGEHELVAEAISGEGKTLRSVPITVHVAGALQPDREGAGATLAISSPARGAMTARGQSLRVEGIAWDGAQVDVEVNGRVVATEVAGANGRFAVDVPLEPGSNLVAIEAASQDGARLVRSQGYAVTAPSSGARKGPGVHDPIPVRGAPPRGLPLRPIR